MKNNLCNRFNASRQCLLSLILNFALFEPSVILLHCVLVSCLSVSVYMKEIFADPLKKGTFYSLENVVTMDMYQNHYISFEYLSFFHVFYY